MTGRVCDGIPVCPPAHSEGPAGSSEAPSALVRRRAPGFHTRIRNDRSSARYLCWFAGLFCDCPCFLPVLQSREMAGSSDTLKVGDRAPEFTLSAANRTDSFSLTDILKKGPAVLEFLRGTW